MEKRTQKLFNSIVKEHIKTALPVSSNLLVEKYNLDVSPATVRNEMALLEEEGYIYQPHTSAGRVPTEKGYRFYIDNFLAVKEPSENNRQNLKDIVKKEKQDNQQYIKNIAKMMADISGELVYVGFNPQNVYYTGISNIFSQPEFLERGVAYDISQVVDRLDEVMNKIDSGDMEEARIIIGSQNPFGNMCATILVSYCIDDECGVFGLLGPMRMDYNGNVGLINYVKGLINNL